jgi:hypothetical protein
MKLQLEHKFVKSVPRELESGVLYISLDYSTVVHSCCCGCGEEVVTPLSPTDWNMTFDGVSVSLSPSVGNWNLKCRSHYVIRRNEVIQAGSWSQEKIDLERMRDKHSKAKYYDAGSSQHMPPSFPVQRPVAKTAKGTFLSWLSKVLK